MIDAVAVLLVVAGVGLAIGWAVTDRPRKEVGFAAAAIAVIAGSLLALRTPLVGRAAADASVRQATAARASVRAHEIADLRARVESQAEQIAANAAESKRVATELRSKLARSEQRVALLEDSARRRGELLRLERAAAMDRTAPSEAVVALSDAPGLSARQAELLATSLRGSGTHELTLTTLGDDAEALAFAERLKTAIEAGGWTVHVESAAASEPSLVGLEVRAPNPLPAHFAALLGALGRAGLQPKGSSRQPVDRLEVLVGSVPGRS
jgi:hypothetical protein